MSEATFSRSIDDIVSASWLDHVQNLLGEAWTAVPSIPDLDRMMFELAVVEIATNVYTHAETTVGAVRVNVRLDVSADHLDATMRDTATAVQIDLDSLSMPGEDSESGRGIPLAQRALDELRHEADPSGSGNVWYLSRAVDLADA